MSTNTITSTGELEKKSRSELVELYNSLVPNKPVKQFKDKTTAVRQVLKAMSAAQPVEESKPAPSSKPKKPELADDAGAPKDEPEEKPKKGKKPPVTTSESPRRVQFDLPAKKDIKPHREGTKRARVIELLSQKGGATFEEVMDDPKIQWDRRTTYEGIKLINTQVGYGLAENPTTHKITLVKP